MLQGRGSTVDGLCMEVYVMKTTVRIAAGVVFAALVIALAYAGQTMYTTAQAGNVEAMEDRIIELNNLYRAQAGLPPLAESDALNRAADIRVQECGSCFSHTRPDGSEWWTVEPDYAYGENLALGYTDADATVDAWMRSPAHMYNIMSPDFHTCGVGVEIIGGTVYYVAEYGY